MRTALLLWLCSIAAAAQTADALSPPVRKYLEVSTPVVVLEHVRIIDGTGKPPLPDRNLTLERGKISAISAGADEPPREGATILDLRGHSVIPGIVGMHEHLFYLALPRMAADGSFERPALFQPTRFAATRLYLAGGVTTARTAGTDDPSGDLELKREVEAGIVPGPHFDVTGPYLGKFPSLGGAEGARRAVAFWAERGVTSFKAYKYITREEMRAALEEAHRHGLKLTGHLCSVSYPEAIELGIDNLEHGFFENSALFPGRKPDVCSEEAGDDSLEHLEPGGAEAARLIALLVQRHVALTSTLPGAAARAEPQPMRPAILEAMAAPLRLSSLQARDRSPAPDARAARHLHREMELERAFVAAGGLLIAGADPVGVGGNLPGFGDQRELELLVEAGFAPVEAIRIATLNGATYLGRDDRIGSIAPGKNADLVVVRGDPSARIADVENVEIVFKDGAGYDPARLLESARGHYGEY